MAATVQIYAGGSLLAAATNLGANQVMPLLVIMVLAYTLISGLEAPVVTDCVQLGVMLLVGGVIVVGSIVLGGGEMHWRGTKGGLNPFSPGLALTTGVISSIGLLSGWIGDQQFWQRCLALRREAVVPAFVTSKYNGDNDCLDYGG